MRTREDVVAYARKSSFNFLGGHVVREYAGGTSSWYVFHRRRTKERPRNLTVDVGGQLFFCAQVKNFSVNAWCRTRDETSVHFTLVAWCTFQCAGVRQVTAQSTTQSNTAEKWQPDARSSIVRLIWQDKPCVTFRLEPGHRQCFGRGARGATVYFGMRGQWLEMMQD